MIEAHINNRLVNLAGYDDELVSKARAGFETFPAGKTTVDFVRLRSEVANEKRRTGASALSPWLGGDILYWVRPQITISNVLSNGAA